ncbi:MAG: preprotein translocase subunit SecE [Christensenellaceae bacterium]|nr:preprotein translocase subunit SecE [Christensenellaceae bacterium]
MAKTKLLGEEKQRQLKEQKKIAKQKNKKKRRGPIRFFKDVGGELKKVTWPTGKELMKTTISVIIFIAIFAVIVYGIDTGLGAVFRLIVT